MVSVAQQCMRCIRTLHVPHRILLKVGVGEAARKRGHIQVHSRILHKVGVGEAARGRGHIQVHFQVRALGARVLCSRQRQCYSHQHTAPMPEAMDLYTKDMSKYRAWSKLTSK